MKTNKTVFCIVVGVVFAVLAVIALVFWGCWAELKARKEAARDKERIEFITQQQARLSRMRELRPLDGFNGLGWREFADRLEQLAVQGVDLHTGHFAFKLEDLGTNKSELNRFRVQEAGIRFNNKALLLLDQIDGQEGEDGNRVEFPAWIPCTEKLDEQLNDLQASAALVGLQLNNLPLAAQTVEGASPVGEKGSTSEKLVRDWHTECAKELYRELFWYPDDGPGEGDPSPKALAEAVATHRDRMLVSSSELSTANLRKAKNAAYARWGHRFVIAFRQQRNRMTFYEADDFARGMTTIQEESGLSWRQFGGTSEAEILLLIGQVPPGSGLQAPLPPSD